MSFLAELGDIIARHLAENGVGIFRPDGVYAPDETGIVFGAVPAEPARVVALLLYPLTADADADAKYGLRIRYRSSGADPRDTLDAVDATFDALAYAGERQLGLAVHLLTRATSNASGTDQNGRYLHTDTYQIDAHHPTRYRA
ncbi:MULTISPECIES: minor capsid protein [Amycolatopsis]|uniref:Minor capsid protein n=1 Tax=Amycolatopsis albidoflavus TaxID=102226 RepID=A0ABW5HQM6_9PSEU